MKRKMRIAIIICSLALISLLVLKNNNEIIQPTQTYSNLLAKWENEREYGSSFSTTVFPYQFEGNPSRLINDAVYKQDVYALDYKESVKFDIEVEETGIYEFKFDYYPLEQGIKSVEIGLKINNDYANDESRRMILDSYWRPVTNEFSVNRFNNEVIPKQERIYRWYTSELPIQFYLEAGINKVEVENLRSSMLLGTINVESPEKTVSYEEYFSNIQSNSQLEGIILSHEAEKITYKNSPSIRPGSNRKLSVTPYDTYQSLLNILDGDSFNKRGRMVAWEIDVPKSGNYKITFDAMTDSSEDNYPVFRKIMIDGNLPFREMEHYRFLSSGDFRNYTLADDNNQPYLFYLEEGNHIISMAVDMAPLSFVIDRSNDVLREINDLALDIKKITGNNNDKYRDWEISDYIPNIKESLLLWRDIAEECLNYLLVLSNGEKTSSITDLIYIIDKLEELAIDPNEIPYRLSELSEGSSSVAEMVSSLMLDLTYQPLTIDKIILHSSEVELASEKASLFAQIAEGFKRFVNSFSSNQYTTKYDPENEINVWVNRSRQYVDIMQNMIDSDFTEQTGIKVKLSIMPNEQKLILANASGKQPDVALGISQWLPYELAVRGAAQELNEFEGFEEVVSLYSKGALLPLTINDSLYGIPVTQDFFVLFYRKDIFEKLNLPVPNTWDEVKEILPELQRYGMNFYLPLAGEGGFKSFMTTSPFIYQSGGDLYAREGIGTGIDSKEAIEGIELMTDLFTLYSIPMQVPKFYQHFRYGRLPIGIGTFGNYVELTYAAPEIAGLWGIAPQPGIENDEGVVERWASGSAQAAMIFKGSPNKEKGWQFLKWWMSTEVQSNYSDLLISTFGEEYMYNTANVEAFKQNQLPQEDIDVIIEQWEWLINVPKMPGSYMLERELSNVWNYVVFDDMNIQEAVDDATIRINREMRRKMEEFEQIQDSIFTDFKVPTIEKVEGWLEDEEE